MVGNVVKNKRQEMVKNNHRISKKFLTIFLLIFNYYLIIELIINLTKLIIITIWILNENVIYYN